MWIELKERTTIQGIARQPGFRIDYPRSAALALISNNQARGVPGPHEGRSTAGYRVGVDPPEVKDSEKSDVVMLEAQQSEPEPDEPEPEKENKSDESESEDEPEDGKTPVEDINFTSIHKVGEARVAKIQDYLEDEKVEALSPDDELTEIPGIGPAGAEELEEMLRDDGTD